MTIGVGAKVCAGSYDRYGVCPVGSRRVHNGHRNFTAH